MSRFFTFLFFLAYSTFAFSAHEFYFNESVALDTQGNFDLSVLVSQKSSWTQREILERLRFSNQALKTCGHKIRTVFFFSWHPSSGLIRVDDLDSSEAHTYDGMKEASAKAPLITPIRLFYFEDYLEPFSSAGSFALAVFDNSTANLNNTAWFPYRSYYRHTQKPTSYSMEAHELGHLLLREGHNNIGAKNILSDRSSSRNNSFLPSQCTKMVFPTFVSDTDPCQKHKEKLLPFFRVHQQTYSKDFYMNLWCARNADNLQKRLNLHLDLNLNIVYMMIPNKSLKPLQARRPDTTWSFHAFLVTSEGIVLDLDFAREESLENISNYLKLMFSAEQIQQAQFILEPASKIYDYTFVRIQSKFSDSPDEILSSQELVSFFSSGSCF